MQAQWDGKYKFILVYQDPLTKYVLLRPLKHKRCEEVTYVIIHFNNFRIKFTVGQRSKIWKSGCNRNMCNVARL